MPNKRYRTNPKRKTRLNYDEYQSTSCSELDSDTGFLPGSIKRNRRGQVIHSPDATNRTRPRRTTRCSTVSPGGKFSPPTVSRTHRSGEQVQQNGNKPTPTGTASSSRRACNATTAAQLKKFEKEMAKAAEQRRESIIGVLSDRIMSRLVSMGDVSRDVAQVCSSQLGWKEDEWKANIKDSKILVYEPLEPEVLPTRKRAYSSARKPLSHAPKIWGSSLEVDALSLCITKAGANRVCFQDDGHQNRTFTSQSERSPAWNHVDDLSGVRSVFVHRDVVQEFLSDGSSVIKLVQKEPRVQFFTFGGGKASTSLNSPPVNPGIEMVLCAGAVIVPTFDSIFKNYTDDDQKCHQSFQKMKDVYHVNPFVKICLHPSMKIQLAKTLEENEPDIDMDLLLDFLTEEFDLPNENRVMSLRNWIELDRNVISWLWSDPTESRYEDCDDEGFEVAMIVKTLKRIQKELYTDFRRFIIAIPEGHLYADQTSIEGIELMKISKLSESLPSGLV